jgi:hypothetical protein
MSKKPKKPKKIKKSEKEKIARVKAALAKFLGPEAINETEVTLQVTFKDGTKKSWDVSTT